MQRGEVWVGDERKLPANGAGKNTFRFVPPLIITRDEIREAMSRMRDAIAATDGRLR